MAGSYRDETEAALRRVESQQRQIEALRAALEEKGLTAPDPTSVSHDEQRGWGAVTVIFAVPIAGALLIMVVALWLVLRS